MTKVLVVDDEIPEQRHLSEILYSSFSGSVTLQCANNGKEAVAQATLWNPDIVLMDIEMPQMNGIEATKQILESNPSCRIIFVTAYSLFEYLFVTCEVHQRFLLLPCVVLLCFK